MKVLAVCVAMFAAALFSIGLTVANAQTREARGVVCVVGDLEMGPNNATKEIYESPNVDILVHQTSAECRILTAEHGR